MRCTHMVLAFAVLVGGAAAVSAVDFVAVAKVPAPVKEAGAKAAPGAKWIIGARITIDGKESYRLLGKQGAKTVRFTATATGTKGYAEVYVSVTDVPKVVTDALEAKMPGFKIKGVRTIGRTTDMVIGYIFEGTTGSEVFVKADGSMVVKM